MGPFEKEGEKERRKGYGNGGDCPAERIDPNPTPSEESGPRESGRLLRYPCSHRGDGRR